MGRSLIIPLGRQKVPLQMHFASGIYPREKALRITTITNLVLYA
jgi:hypothetical protein